MLSFRSVQNPTHPVQYPSPRRPVRVPAVELRDRVHPEDHLLLWQLRGRTHLSLDGSPITLEAGHALWQPVGVRHSFTQEHNSAVFPVFFNAERTATTLHEPRLVAVDDDLSMLLLAQLQVQYTAIQPNADILRQILALVEERALLSSELPLPESPEAREVAEALRFNPGDGRSVPELAAMVHVSERTIERAFLAETGMTLRMWRQRNRLEAATTLLRDAASPSAVAHRVGYRNESAFRRAFKAHYEMTPRQFAELGR